MHKLLRTLIFWGWAILLASISQSVLSQEKIENRSISEQSKLPVAKEPTDKPIPKTKPVFMGRRIAPTMGYAHASWLTRSSRNEEEDPQQTLDRLKLLPGMVVCDMGCGNGFYTLEMASRVMPGGKVFAVDIQPEMLHLLELRAEEQKVANIEVVLGGLVDPRMPADSIDLLLMVDVYHEFSHPALMLKEIRNCLKPTGRIALVEFRAEDPTVPILPLHKMSKQQILKEYKANGLRLVEEYDKLPWQHLMFFERDPSWKEKPEVTKE